MKIRTHRQPLIVLESVAITDIILNMFIFFFISFSLVYTFNPAREAHIQVSLPQAEAQPQAPGREPIVVNISAKGEVYLGSARTTLPRLTQEVRRRLADQGTAPVIVRSDKGVVFDTVVKVIEAVNKGGAERLSVAVEHKKSE